MLRGRIKGIQEKAGRTTLRNKHKPGSKSARLKKSQLNKESSKLDQGVAPKRTTQSPVTPKTKVVVNTTQALGLVSVGHAIRSAERLKHMRLRGQMEALERAEEMLLHTPSLDGWPRRGTYAWKVVYGDLSPGQKPTLRHIKDKIHLTRQELKSISK